MNIDTALVSPEKIKLAEKLWNDIEAERAAPLSSAQQGLLQDRLKFGEENPNNGKSWQEVKTKYLSDNV